MAARKETRGKLRLELVPPELMEHMARVLEYGARKYGDENWRRGLPYSFFYAAALRHLLAWYAGDDDDEESKLPHLAHAVCNLVFLLCYQDWGLKAFDDRIRKNPEIKKEDDNDDEVPF